MINQETWPNHFKALTTFFQSTQSSNYIDLCFYHSCLSITVPVYQLVWLKYLLLYNISKPGNSYYNLTII